MTRKALRRLFPLGPPLVVNPLVGTGPGDDACADARTALSPPQISRTTRHPFTHAAEGSPPMKSYRDFHRRSIEQPEAFWREQAQRIHWETPFERCSSRIRRSPAGLSAAAPICATTRWTGIWPSAAANALIYVSTETGIERRNLRRTERRSEAHGRRDASLGVTRGDGSDLHAEDSRGGVCDARLRAHRRHAFGGVRRLCCAHLAARIDDRNPC